MAIQPRTVQVGKLQIEYDLADFTDPWRTDVPETLFLHHGYCRTMDFWRAWVPLLARDYRVLRINGRGCGGTTVPAPEEPYGLDLLVDDVMGVLDALSIPRITWVGESSGGIIGIATALRYPDRINALVLCDTPFKIPSLTSNRFNVGEPDFDTALKKHGFKAICRHTLGDRLDLSRASPELQAWYVETMGSAPEHVARAHHIMANQTNMLPRFPELKLPTLLLAGAGSKVAESDKMQQMQAALPNAKLVSFEGYGHGVNLLAPDRCVAEVRSFLQGLSPLPQA